MRFYIDCLEQYHTRRSMEKKIPSDSNFRMFMFNCVLHQSLNFPSFRVNADSFIVYIINSGFFYS